MFECIKSLNALGGTARPSEIFASTTQRVHLSEVESEAVTSGPPRWQVHVRFRVIQLVKAGFVTREGGRWTLTDKGRDMLKNGATAMMQAARKAYDARDDNELNETDDAHEAEGNPEQTIQLTYDNAVEIARTGIEDHLNEMSGHEFQNLVAELLIAMGYHVSYVAPPGKDGGIDIIAFQDPLGLTGPRLKVQVKHRDVSMRVQEFRELQGLLRSESDVGLLVSSEGFTPDAMKEARSSHHRIETMDLPRFIKLWIEHYSKISEAGRSLLPLVPVHYLKPTTLDE